jgi:membrane protein DedA with SNARE-associated domain
MSRFPIMFESAPFVTHFPYLGIFLLLILGGIGLPFPEDVTLLLGGFLMAHHVIKPLPAFLVVYSGLLITDFSLYLVGKKYGRRIVEHKRFHEMISPNRLSKLEDKFSKWGSLVIFFGRHILGLRAQIFLVSGVMKMSAIKFLIADAISALFTIGLWGGVGYLGGNSVQVLKKDITRVDHIAIVIVVIMIAGGIIFWYLKNVKKSSKT